MVDVNNIFYYRKSLKSNTNNHKLQIGNFDYNISINYNAFYHTFTAD